MTAARRVTWSSRQRGPGADHLGDEVVRQRDVHPGQQQRDRRHQPAEQHAADEVGDPVRAQHPAVQRDHADDGGRGDLPGEPLPGGLAGDGHGGPGGDGRADDRRQVAGGVRVPVGGEHLERLRRPRPADDELDQPVAAPAEHDHQHQREAQLAQPALPGPDGQPGDGAVHEPGVGQQRERRADLREPRPGRQRRGEEHPVQRRDRGEGQDEPGPHHERDPQHDGDGDRRQRRRAADHGGSSIPGAASVT